MSLTRVSPALFATSNNITSVTVGGSANTVSLTFDSNGVITGASNNALSVANTQITGNIVSSQISPSVTLTTPIISGNLNLDSTGTTGVRVPSANTIAFHTAGTEDMRITSAGDVCVGRTSTLGSVKFVVESDTTTYNPMTVSNLRATAATDYSIVFYRAGNIVGSVQTSLSATSFVTSSDYRLKENIAPMTGALAKVAQLKPVTYDWKVGGSSQGFIAHELQAVVPDCVTGKKDDVDNEGKAVHQGIDTSFLVATLTAAIQELKAIVDAQAVRIAALEIK